MDVIILVLKTVLIALPFQLGDVGIVARPVGRVKLQVGEGFARLQYGIYLRYCPREW